MVSDLAFFLSEIKQVSSSLIAKIDTNNFGTDEPNEIFGIPNELAHFEMDMGEPLVNNCCLLGPTHNVFISCLLEHGVQLRH